MIDYEASSDIDTTEYHRADDELNVAHEWPLLPDVCRYQMLHAGISVLMCKAPEMSNGIYLTDRTSGNRTPDAGIVTAVRGDVPLKVGDRIYIRPYVGCWVETEEGVYRLLGKECFEGDATLSKVHWSDHVLAYEDMSPTPGNLGIEPDKADSIIQQINERPRHTATVVSVPNGSGFRVGQRVVMKPGAQVMRFVGASGKLMKEDDVLAVIE